MADRELQRVRKRVVSSCGERLSWIALRCLFDPRTLHLVSGTSFSIQRRPAILASIFTTMITGLLAILASVWVASRPAFLNMMSTPSKDLLPYVITYVVLWLLIAATTLRKLPSTSSTRPYPTDVRPRRRPKPSLDPHPRFGTAHKIPAVPHLSYETRSLCQARSPSLGMEALVGTSSVHNVTLHPRRPFFEYCDT